VYLKYEILRAFRSPRFFVFSLGFPVVLYYAIAAPNRDISDFGGTGVSAPLYYMVGLISFGTVAAMLSAGVRISGERAAGWNRQLRLTPLAPGAYFRTKAITSYVVALLTIIVLYAAGLSLGVSLEALVWLRMTLLILVGLIPFAALGILLGHWLKVDSVAPVVGGLTGLLPLISGTWFPLGHGVVYQIARFLPSYWVVQASQVALGGPGWTAFGWAVVLVWSGVLAVLTVRAYRMDTRPV
jgi:ABC-2 type transport system permease protein